MTRRLVFQSLAALLVARIPGRTAPAAGANAGSFSHPVMGTALSYPRKAVYTGRGSTDEAANFVCQ